MRVLAALSGGVDSAVAAARAVDAGHDVTGVHLALARDPRSHRTGARGCCSLEDSRDARRVADVVGVPYYVWDLADRFHDDVIADFVAEYAAGRTPNPCVRCNERIKFAAVLERAVALGFDAVCTGHYARLVDGPTGRQLHRAVDTAKDQSYVLGVLDGWQLDRALFPLGDSHKHAVRREAAERGLLVADKPDSHDVCFIPDGDTAGWLRDRLGEQPGDVVDVQTGQVVGAHHGTYGFTVGQRRGLALADPAPDGQRRYVVDVDPLSHKVFVGSSELLGVSEVTGTGWRWCGRESAGPGFDADVQLRAHGTPVPARATVTGGDVVISLRENVRGVAPGQLAVLYDGTRVLGSATVAATATPIT
ncbi:MAG: tRNA 2-thiouridine(34) synthase MnmA [Actinomycetota bacterium]|nr:MAG: tRNA 2-thiouridine(34) synthase MnmA [Actinomycetota bacterium]